MILRYALVVDGSSDAVLEPIVRWVLREGRPAIGIEVPAIVARGGRPVREACEATAARTGASVLVVHRDAENVAWERRLSEIPLRPDIVRVVPVRMTEAWLLGDERAIRLAAGNPNGEHPLGLPRDVEAEADPKKALRGSLLAAAGEPTGRRRRQLQADLARRSHLVAEYTGSFEHLRRLVPFAAFERELLAAVDAWAGAN